jgi:7-carboxy-7-deazaguanine synthase (Cx14CxxC type)
MSYAIKEVFYTLQGEGSNAGRPAVFCRFSGCNLWSGVEHDRNIARCSFCDTDFVGMDGSFGGRYRTAANLVDVIQQHWVSSLPSAKPFVVCTGGEPALQLDTDLVSALHDAGFSIAVETNGSLDLPEHIDWITMSPKAGVPLRVTRGNEIKVVWPQPDLDLNELEDLDFELRYLQPMDGDRLNENMRKCVEVCLRRPLWRMSLQTHKLLGIR